MTIEKLIHRVEIVDKNLARWTVPCDTEQVIVVALVHAVGDSIDTLTVTHRPTGTAILGMLGFPPMPSCFARAQQCVIELLALEIDWNTADREALLAMCKPHRDRIEMIRTDALLWRMLRFEGEDAL